MEPASPPLPTATSLWFHVFGIHNSIRTSFSMVAATRQNAGVWMVLFPRPPGTVNGPAATETADVTVMEGSFKEPRLSQLCCPHAALATESAEIARVVRIRGIGMSISSLRFPGGQAGLLDQAPQNGP